MKKKVVKEDFTGLENLLTGALNKVIAWDESTMKMSYACDDCKYMWLEDTYKSNEYREGYSCPKCGSESISGKK